TGPDGKTYENTETEILKATHRKRTEKTSGSETLYIDAFTDTLEVAVTGDVSAAAPALIASYDAEGRFLGLVVATEPADGPIEAPDGAVSVKVFWIDENEAPKSDDEEIERQDD
ncbi:MAG: hypothetical protein K5981_02505, partial [Clostridia bacterium]|nr:hypothetical protein [Clostridia bacterium]